MKISYQSMSTSDDYDEDGNILSDDGNIWMDVTEEDYYRLLNLPEMRSRKLIILEEQRT